MRYGVHNKPSAPAGMLRGFLGECVVRISTLRVIGSKLIAKPSQRQAGSLSDAHDVPAIGNGVAKGVDAALRIDDWTRSRGKNHAGGANGGAHRAGPHDAHADGASRLIASAGDNGDACMYAGFARAFGGDRSSDFLRFKKFGKQGLVYFGSLENFVGPFPSGHVEHQRSGCVGHIDGACAREAKADVILRQHDGADARPNLRLELAHPPDLGQRESGKGRIGGEFNQTACADFFGDGFALCVGALIAPDDGRAENVAVSVEQNEAVHLSAEADGGNFSGICF